MTRPRTSPATRHEGAERRSRSARRQRADGRPSWRAPGARRPPGPGRAGAARRTARAHRGVRPRDGGAARSCNGPSRCGRDLERDRCAADPPRPDPGLHLRQRAHRARSVASAPQGPRPGEGDAGRPDGPRRARGHGSGVGDSGRAGRRAAPGRGPLRHPRRRPSRIHSRSRASATSRRGSTAASSTSPRRSRSSPTCSSGTSATAAVIGPGGWWRWTASTASSSSEATHHGWLTNPTHYVEPPRYVVRRYWQAILDEVRVATMEGGCSCAGTPDPSARSQHPRSGTIPVSRNNVEDVRIRVHVDRSTPRSPMRPRRRDRHPDAVTPTWAC